MTTPEPIVITTNQPDWTKPARGQLGYILHQDDDTSWRVVCLKADLPKDKGTIRAILTSALASLGTNPQEGV